jgi:hypothetical protein
MNMAINENKYRQCMQRSRRIFWDIDDDVICGRELSAEENFLPAGLTLAEKLHFLDGADRRLFGQVQGRSYAYIFGLVERFIGAKIVEMSNEHALGDQDAMAAMLQFGVEELKHQELFRRMEQLADAVLPAGYRQTADPNDVAMAVLSKSTWAVLGLTCHIEIFTQAHYLESIRDNDELSALFKDVFRYHWSEESQHAILDELEWARVHATMTPEEIDAAVGELIELVVALDGVIQAQADADAEYFLANCRVAYDPQQQSAVHDVMLRAYRWQYIVSGVQIERFQKALAEKVTHQQMERIQTALSPLVEHVTGSSNPVA